MLLGGYLVLAALLVAVDRLVAGVPGVAALPALGLVSAVAIGLALRVRRPAPSWPGWCLAGSLLLMSCGDTVFSYLQVGGSMPFASAADVFFLASYVPLVLGLLGLGGRLRLSRPLLLDAAVVAVASAVPLWVLVAAPAATDGEVLDRVISCAYPLCDLVLLVVLSGVLLSRRSGPGDWLLLGGALGLVWSDVAFALLSTGSTLPFALVDAGWWLQRVLWVVALLGPWPPGGRPRAARAPGRTRLGLLALLTATAPVSLLLVPDPEPRQVLVITAGAVLLALLAMLRLSGVADDLRVALRRQQSDARAARAVAEAGALLLPGLDRGQVQRAALAGVLRLLEGAGERAAVALAIGPPELLELVAADGHGLTPGQVASVDLSLLTDDDVRDLVAGRVVQRERVEHEDDELLVLPLSAAGRAVGAVVVAAPRAVVQAALPQLTAFSCQLALALEGARIRAGDERRRHTEQARLPDSGLAQRTLGGSPTPLLVADLARGLRQGEIVAYYQPIVAMDSGRACGFEALVRWRHPQRGLLTPDRFLPQAEEAGLLAQLDALVLTQACRQAVAWDPSHQGPYVSVNLSADQLVDPRLVPQVLGVLAATGLAPWRLLVEVTETAAVSDPSGVAEALARLRTRQVRVAFDDFGTGYSSLSWLQQLPLDVVKIDKTFVDRLPRPAGHRPVVEALVRMAQTMGLEVIAEGVERPAQASALAEMGVLHAQGWLWSPAVPGQQAGALLPGPAPAVTAAGPLLAEA